MLHNLDAEKAAEYLHKNKKCKYDTTKAHVKVSTDSRLLDLIERDLVSHGSAYIAMKLSRLITCRNIAYTDNKRIAETAGISRANVARCLKELLEEGLVYTKQPKGKTKSDKTLIFNPSLFWKGSYKLRDAIEERILIGGEDWWDVDVA